MAIDKIQSESINLADNFAFTGTVTGAGGVNTPAFFARCSTQQSIANQTVTKIQFDTEIYDTDGKYDNSSNYRFTPGVAGKYNFTLSVSLDDVADQGNFYLYLYKNGSAASSAITRVRGSGVEKMTSFCHWSDTANTTDYYEGYVYHGSGSAEVLRPDLATTFLGYKIIT